MPADGQRRGEEEGEQCTAGVCDVQRSEWKQRWAARKLVKRPCPVGAGGWMMMERYVGKGKGGI